MSVLIDTDELKKACEGSFEASCFAVSEAVDGTILATFPEKVVYEKNGKIVESSWTITDGEVELGDPAPSKVSTYEGDDADILVGRILRDTVESMMNGETCNQLHEMIEHVKIDGLYFPGQLD